MRLAFVFAVAVLGGPVQTRAVILPMPAFTEGAVQRAVDTAARKLVLPACPGVYDEFRLPDGDTPRSRLDEMGLGPDEFLGRLVFVDGSRDRVCQTGAVGLATTPGSRLIRVCPRFADLELHKPALAGVLIIHESLHALGLGENPPTSSEITQHVEWRCSKEAKRRGEDRPSSEARLTPVGGSD